jgi:hypothetical protein
MWMNDSGSTFSQGQDNQLKNRRGRFELIFLLAIAAAARLAWLAILPSKAISLDLLTWKWVAVDLLGNVNPYAAPPWLNHPPFWTEVIYLLATLSRKTGADFIVSIKLVLIAGDLCLLAATYLLLRTLRPGADCRRLLIVGYCLNPLLILLTVQHSNFDLLSMVWVLLLLYFLVRSRNSSDGTDWLASAACLGIAVFIKQFPLVLWPLLAPGARRLDWRYKLVGLLLMLGPVLLSLAPLYVLSPETVWQNVVGYRSLGNTFGVVGILTLLGLDHFLPLYSHIFTAVVLIATVVMAVALWRRDWTHDADPVLFSAVLLLGLFTLGTGYGSQYWFWVIPLILVCYPNFGSALARMIWISMSIVVATSIFEYAVELNLGRFLYNFSPSPRLQAISDYFTYPSIHLIWLRIPMTFAAFALLATGILALKRQHKRRSEHNLKHIITNNL